MKSLVTGLLIVACTCLAAPVIAQCPASLPATGGALPGPLPLFPADHWWNADVSAAPVDANSASYIAYIGTTRRLHPDFGGDAGGTDIYGMPYAVVDGAQPKLPVTFQYWDESDGVNFTTTQGLPFYPIPAQAIAQPRWIEGGAPGDVDQRNQGDRHLLIVDCTNRHLYELYNVFYDTQQARWHAGSGAFFDLTKSDRRPEGWTSADAAGLAILPGLVRYDEAWNPAVADIGHAFRVTVRATNGYVYPASHRAGSTAGALPMGARLRLKASVGGQDPALRSTDPNVRKIFRAMQKRGLIVADNGSDLYITGTYDTRWNNDILNPAFALLQASDFDVVELGWKPATNAGTVALVEYRHSGWDHYFMTGLANEIAQLDAGAFAGWARTGHAINAYPTGATAGVPMCRFFSTSFAPRSSHFYTPLAAECATVKANPDWSFEGDVFNVVLPAAEGGCAAGTRPLFRLYNDGQGGAPNHRYTTDTDVRAQMVASGWIAEGYGVLGVIGCVPG
jgi:hypothetical protein